MAFELDRDARESTSAVGAFPPRSPQGDVSRGDGAALHRSSRKEDPARTFPLGPPGDGSDRGVSRERSPLAEGGLRVSRRFVPEGVDPYSTVEWERRTTR